jgi:predicted permease
MWARLRNKLRFILRRNRFDRELDEELEFHRDMLERDNARDGLDPAAARTLAHRQLGNAVVAREESRQAWLFGWLDSTARDISSALRGCRRAPAFSFAAILTLALGIGANAAVFRVLDAIVLRPLPVRDPASLVRLQGFRDGKRTSFSQPLFQEMAVRQQALVGMTATLDVPGVAIAAPGSDPFAGASARLTTGNFFSVLGTDAAVGRFFSDADDRRSAPAVAVISHGLWQRAFGGQPDVIGRTLRINTVQVTVVGVTTSAFFGERMGAAPDVWLPMSLAADLGIGWLLAPGSSMLSPMGRLRPGVSREQAQAMLDGLYRHLADYDVKILGTKTIALEVQPGARGLQGIQDELANPLWMLMAAVGLVVLIACCNLASLLLARAAARTQEIGVRLALGATRGRLVRQLLTESLLLSAAGGAIGIAIGAWGSRELVGLAAAESWRVPVTMDWRAAGFAAALSFVTACIFGLPSALRASLGQPSLQATFRTRDGLGSSRRVARGFVVAQVSISVLLVAGASLLGRSFWNLTHQDFGYRADGLALVRLPFDVGNFKLTRDPAFCDELERRMHALPGALSAALAGAGPLGTVHRLGKIALPERPAVAGDEVRFVSVSPRYFETMGIEIVAGRPITNDDRQGSRRVAIISQTAARRIFGQENPIGRTFTNGDRFEPERVIEIVGVAHDIRFAYPREPFGLVVFQPLRQSPAPLTSIVVRTSGDAARVSKIAEQALRDAAPGLKIADAVSVTLVVQAGLSHDRMMAALSATFAIVAMLLAAVGLYGVTAYGIAQRTREIGVRLALGATRARVLGQFLREVATLLLAGLAIGGTATLIVGRLLTAFLFGLSPQDPYMLSFAAALLATVTMLAGYLAARHAAALDPLRAIRQD